MFQGVELSLETTCCGLACTVSGLGLRGAIWGQKMVLGLSYTYGSFRKLGYLI